MQREGQTEFERGGSTARHGKASLLASTPCTNASFGDMWAQLLALMWIPRQCIVDLAGASAILAGCSRDPPKRLGIHRWVHGCGPFQVRAEDAREPSFRPIKLGNDHEARPSPPFHAVRRTLHREGRCAVAQAQRNLPQSEPTVGASLTFSPGYNIWIRELHCKTERMTWSTERHTVEYKGADLGAGADLDVGLQIDLLLVIARRG